MPLTIADVADAHLILEDQEEAGDHVLDERLRAEADGEADDAGAGEHRRDVHVQRAEHHQQRRDGPITVVRKRLSVLPMVWARLRRSMSAGPAPSDHSSRCARDDEW